METPSVYLNASYSEPCIKRKRIRIDTKKFANPYIPKQPLLTTPKKEPMLEPVKPKRKTQILTQSFCRNVTDLRGPNSSFILPEKSRQLQLKLTHLLSEKSTIEGYFSIYSQIFSELADYLVEFRELLMILKKGMVVYGIQEREFAEFEFKACLAERQNDLSVLLEKERKEKVLMVKKLNRLSDEIVEVRAKYEELAKKYVEYEKIIKSDPNKFIEAEKLLEKMMKQCQIINKQQNYICELQMNESRMKKIIGICEKKGFLMEEALRQNKNSVLNPNIAHIVMRCNTITPNAKSNLDSSSESSDKETENINL